MLFSAFNNGGLFGRGLEPNEIGFRNDLFASLLLPNHGLLESQPAQAPLGTGIAILAALGGAYLVAKKRKEE